MNRQGLASFYVHELALKKNTKNSSLIKIVRLDKSNRIFRYVNIYSYNYLFWESENEISGIFDDYDS